MNRIETIYEARICATKAQPDHRFSEGFEERMENMTRKPRAMTRLLVAAAIIAALTLSAFAAYRLIRVQPTHKAAVIVENGDSVELHGSADIRLRMTLPDDAPATPETTYAPVLEGWTRTEQPGLAWEDGKGNFISFRQIAEPGYNGDRAIDSIDLGMTGEYEIGTRMVGDLELQTVTVPGERVKYYWSDGSYIFALETNDGMDAALLEQVFASIRPVAVEYAPERSEERPAVPVSAPSLPALPEEWVMDDGAGTNGNGISYTYLWSLSTADAVFHTQLNKTGESGLCQQTARDWAQDIPAHTCRTEIIDGVTYTVYEKSDKIQILWQIGEAEYSLETSGLLFADTGNSTTALTAKELLAYALTVR